MIRLKICLIIIIVFCLGLFVLFLGYTFQYEGVSPGSAFTNRLGIVWDIKDWTWVICVQSKQSTLCILTFALIIFLFLFYCLFAFIWWDIQLCSEITPNFMLKNHFWKDSENHYGMLGTEHWSATCNESTLILWYLSNPVILASKMKTVCCFLLTFKIYNIYWFAIG